MPELTGKQCVTPDGKSGWIWSTWKHYDAPVVDVQLHDGGTRQCFAHRLLWIEASSLEEASD